MNKDLRISILLDYYKEMLTDRQADAIDLYYNQDLSLTEISQHLNVSRQGVRDFIKRGEKVLYDIEKKLKLAEKYKIIKNQIDNIHYNLDVIKEKDVGKKELEKELNAIKKNIEIIINCI